MKRLIISVYNSKRPPFHVRIRPGLRACDVLFHLGIFNYFLVLATAEDPIKEIFKDPSTGYDLYERVEDGDELIALPAIEAARILWEDMTRKASHKETAP